MPAGGALGYLTVEPPRALSYGPPAVDSSWLANLPQQFQQGQQYARQRDLQTLFQPGTPGAAALERAGVSPNSLFGILAGAGGAETVAPFGQLMMRGQLYDQTAGGGQGAQPTRQDTSDAGGAQPSSGIVTPAQKAAIASIESSEYKNPYQAVGIATKLGHALGKYQVMEANLPQWSREALGRELSPQEFLNSPDAQEKVFEHRFGSYLQKYGNSYDAASAWFTGSPRSAKSGNLRDPLGTSGASYVRKFAAALGNGGAGANTQVTRSDQLNPTDRAAVDRMYSPSALAAPPGAPAVAAASQPGISQPGVAQPATGAPAPVQQPEGAVGSAPFMASSSTNAAGPANVGGRTAAAATMPRPGVPADQQTRPPISPTSTAEVASNVGGGEAAAGGPGPPAGSPSPGARDVVPQGPAATTGQEVGGAVPPGYTRQAIANMRTAATTLEAEGGRLGAYGFPGETSQAKFKQAADLRSQADIREKFLNEREQQRFGVGVEAQKGVQAGDIKRGEATFNGLSAAARQYQSDLKPYLDLTRSIINSPGVYTGAGAQRSLDINRVRAAFGDQKAAMLQEALGKVRAQTVLNTINTQKDEMLEAGGNSGRLFSQQVGQIEKAVPGLETTLAGNRALVEIAGRVGEHQTHVAQMARDYIAAQRQRGLPGYLDQGFDDMLSRDLKLHPLFNAKELEHPELIGAPSVPPGLKSRVDIENWGRSLGLEPGEAVRTPSGDIKALP